MHSTNSDSGIVWAAYWGADNLSDAQMDVIANGNHSPLDYAPDELIIYFHKTPAAGL